LIKIENKKGIYYLTLKIESNHTIKYNLENANEIMATCVQRRKQFVLECKVCRDAGKEYKGHSVRNKQGKVVCPTLLSQACSYCYGVGHTPKYCPELKNKKKNTHHQNYYTTNNNKKRQIQKKNVFDILADADEEDECDSDHDKYAPIYPEKTPEPIVTNSWAHVVSKEPIRIEKPIVITTPVVEEVRKLKPRPKLWSEYDSDEEYED